jgi:hypothetical protein
MTTRRTKELIHEGEYAVEVPVELIEDDTGLVSLSLIGGCGEA